MDFEAYLRDVCMKLGFRMEIEEFRPAIQYFFDANCSVAYAVFLMRERLGIERVH